MRHADALAGLNPEQRRAVERLSGPVCILAGAGTGKTATITRRIARQVSTGEFAAREILAVTFTDKAAGELRARLAALGVHGVRARTFHASALRQLSFLEPGLGAVLPSKALWLRQIANTLPRPFRFRPAADLATEIEWAKNGRLTPDTYLEQLGTHEPPIPADLAHRVFSRYEARKRRERRIDFEDVLELLVRRYDADPEALARFRAGCRAITVDEYQDVNVLQQSLLERWLGDRDDLCAVGDDYQAIYSFTGASSEHLLAMPRLFPGCLVVRLETNHRSSPQILELANRLVPRLGGAPKTLRAAKPDGPEPELLALADAPAETAFVVERIRALVAGGVPLEEIAVLYRANSRSEDLEAPLAAASVPYQVRGGAFLDRPAARDVLRALRRASGPVASAVEAAARAAGLDERLGDAAGQEELTRQADLRRLVALAREFDVGTRTGAEFAADLDARFRSEGGGRGVQLLTYHRAKGLEFDAVLLPFLQEGELPSRLAKTEVSVAEERRLFYVGLTRARRHLVLTWVSRSPSRFLRELGLVASAPRGQARRAAVDGSPAFEALRKWRLERARADEVPAFVVFADATLHEIAERLPRSPAELLAVKGVGPAKVERYGADVLRVLSGL